MAIDSLSSRSSSLPWPEAAQSLPKQESPHASGFESLLKSVGGGSAAGPQQAAAELLGMEMLQHSLCLFGDDSAAVTPSATGALQRLLDGLAAGNPASRSLPLTAAAPPQAAVGTGTTEDGAGRQPEAFSLDAIGKCAARYLGTPYRFGGEGADGIDCSSLIQHVFRQQGIELPRTAREQSKVGIDVQQGELQKGDLVFFHTYASYPSHVGIYLGDGKMIHASSARGQVTISDLDTDYYRSRFMGAKRIA